MLFVLEDGNDEVYLRQQDTIPNIFLMGNDGIKNFNGASGPDDFVFDSSCSKSLKGFLDGNSGDDSITLGDTCAPDTSITVDLMEGKLSSDSNSLNLMFKGIENVNGRKNYREIYKVACTTKRISSNGGSNTKFDEIHIQSDSNCKYNVTLFVSSYTKILSKATLGIITLVFDHLWAQSQVELDVYPRKKLSLNMFFINTTSSNLTTIVATKINAHLVLVLGTSDSNKMEFKFTMAHDVDDVSVRFTENPLNSPESVLYIQMKTEPSVLFFHTLPVFNGHQLHRTGCKVAENIFDISGPFWRATGGDLSDEFILHTNDFGMINGNGGIDSIKIGQDFSKPLNLDLGSRNIQGIEHVFGIFGNPLTVKTNCETLLVASRGGSKLTPDLIKVPELYCENRNLRIIVEGHVFVTLEKSERHDNDTVQIIANENHELKLELETTSPETGNVFIVIPTLTKNWSVTNAKSHNNLIIVNLRNDDTDDSMKFRFYIETTEEQYLQSPYIQIFYPSSGHIPGVLIFERKSGTPKIIYDLRQTQNESVAEGFVNIQNVFILATSQNPWRVTGGNLSDEFLLRIKQSNYMGQHSILGGGSDNTLILECGEENDKCDETFVINLPKKEFGFLNTPPEETGMIDSVQNVVGRPEGVDIFHANCNTNSINGQGGRTNEKQNDLIKISDQDCDYNLLTIVPEYTTVLNSAKKGKFVYYIYNLSTSNLELYSTQQNKHLLKFTFHPWDVITAIVFNKTTQNLGLKISNSDEEIVHAFKLWAPQKSSEYVNPVFEFSPEGSSVSSDIRVSMDGVTMATFLLGGLEIPKKVHGLPVDVNRFLINITSRSDYSTGEILGCSDGFRCSANQFWIFNLEGSLEVLDGGNCGDYECTNCIYFPSNPNERKLHFDLDTENGRVTTDDGEIVISKLKNIHELHGSKGVSANVRCSTTHVSKLSEVFISQAGCQSDLVIDVSRYTRVIFEETGADYMNITPIENEITTSIPITTEDDDAYYIYKYGDSEMDEDHYELDDDIQQEYNETFENQTETNLTVSTRTIHYRFSSVMSFDPEGSSSEVLGVDHLYYLQFDLNFLENIDFSMTEKRLHYTIDNIDCFHTMISPLFIWDQFYSQPRFLTNDGYSIQVARDGSLWATLGNTSNEITQGSVPYLQEMASNLEITLVIQSFNSFYFIGHSGNKNDDRNVVQNMPDKVSHLAGGGSNNTIYDILALDNDVYIYTGYDKTSHFDWDSSAKQTIDLTDIVVPIRNLSGTKFVPQTISNQTNLVISMQGYEDYFPGQVIIVDGMFPWVAKRIQLLLSGAVMDFVTQEENDIILDDETTTEDLKPRKRRSLEESIEIKWVISPRSLVIPEDVSIYSVSAEDLEDGLEIQLESNTEGKGTFQIVRNGSDLYLTNAVSSNATEIKAIIINDFWENTKLENDEYGENKDGKVMAGVTVRLPGLNVVLNDTKIMVEITGNFSSADNATAVTLKNWNRVLYEFEDILLQDMPDIPRTFSCEECLPWWKQERTKWIVVVATGIISVAFLAIGIFIILREWKEGYYLVATRENFDVTCNTEMMQLSKNE